VRYFGEKATVELDRAELAEWSEASQRMKIDAAVQAAGFAEVELDPRGFRSGALNVLAGLPETP
jgi:PP-loop superfamily ATP-utilizing enzyme